MKNPYDVLGVAEDATNEEIKKAYRKSVFETHPDRNLGDKDAEDRFKEVQSAYDEINGKGNAGATTGFGFDPFEFFHSFSRFDEGGKDMRMPEVAHTTLTFEEAAAGCTKSVLIRRGVCDQCNGTGTPNGEKTPCRECQGNGFIARRAGNMVVQSPCRACLGRGYKKVGGCKACDGTGQGKSENMDVAIPGGVTDGVHVRAGGVIIVVHVTPHPLFEMSGSQVVMNLPINPALAVLGGVADIPSPSGMIGLKIPAGVGHGTVLKLPGAGIKKGDFLVRLYIDTSVIGLNQDQVSAFQTLAASYETNPPPACRSFEEAVREWKERQPT